jgi:hypothetical protein
MNDWIDAKTNPPPRDGRYFVTERHSSWNWVGVCSLREGKWDSPAVIAWQPLPRPSHEN